MDILISGQLASVTKELLEGIAQAHRVVVAGKDVNMKRIGKNVTPFGIAIEESGFEKLFHSFHFQTVIYLSQLLFSKDSSFDDFQDLERCFAHCVEHDINKFIYIMPAIADEDAHRVPSNDRAVLFGACEQLCEYYRERRAMSVLVLRVPCLYGYGEEDSLIGDMIAQAENQAAIHMRGEETQFCQFLSQRDLGQLLLRIADSWTNDYKCMDVPGASTLSFKQVGELLQTYFPTVRLSYAGKAVPMDVELSGDTIKQEYDFLAVSDIAEEMPALIGALKEPVSHEKQTLKQKIGKFVSKHTFVIQGAELLIGYMLMELLNILTATTVQFQYIDFRLLFVVLLGTIHGLKTGFAASLLACLSFLIASISSMTNWYVIAFNIDTWLPFIFYIIIGTVTGYVKDRLRNDYRFLAEEKSILEDKYIMLNEFYASALINRDQYKNQIISYKDSFGRLFDITKKLNSTLVEEVYQEALNALEGILDNRSICIYLCDDDLLFGRLAACSKEIGPVTQKSLPLSKLGRMVEGFKDGEVWANKERLLGYPEYAVPIFRGAQPIAIILIEKAKYEQMGIYYENLIKIICGLVKISLLRAIEFTEKIEDEIYLPGSRILNTAYFRQLLQVKEEMAQDGVSEYSLIRFATTPDNMVSIGTALSKLLRTVDILGVGADGQLYICLAQTNKRNVEVILERIQNAGISFHQMNTGEDA